MITRPPYGLGLAATLALQAAVIGWMVWDRAELIRSGAEVRLTVQPVDPRDLFRGDYVVLNYDISTLRPTLLAGEDAFERNDRIFVVLERSEEIWRPAAIHSRYPTPRAGQVVLAGRVAEVAEEWPFPTGETGPACPFPCPALIVLYGIESYFVPEGAGRDIEQLRDTGKVELVAAVGSGGRAAIKGLIVDGTLLYEEPLY